MLVSALIIADAHAQSADQKFDLYILVGQSNMAGRGKITEEFAKEQNDRVYMLTKDKQWVIAKHPLHFDKPTAVGVGPGLAFGIAMADAYPKAKIGLVPCAVGGTAISRWQPGAYDASTKTHPYDDAIERITEAMKYGTVKGIVWHQGESDSDPKKAEVYLEKLTELVERLRTVIGNPNCPVIVGELGQYRAVYANINTQLAKVPSTIRFTGLALSDGLVHKGDTTHFDSPSATEMGKRMAVQMLKVQGKEKK